MRRVRRRKPRPRTRKPFWVVLLLCVGAFLVAWWIWPGYYRASPRFESMLLQKNEEVLLVMNGDTLELHPQDKVKILKISTSVTFNVGVRLYASGLDVDALSYEKLSMASLLPKEESGGEQRFKVYIKFLNQDIGSVSVLVRPYVEDWLEKAERTIEPARRIEILEEALKFAPQERRIRTKLLEEYKSQRKWQEAVGLLESMAREKEDAQVLEDLVEFYESMNNMAGTLSSLGRLVRLRPDDPKSHLRYASALEKAKKTKEAIVEYEEALRKTDKGERIELYKTLGYLYSSTGETTKAIQYYSNAFEIDRGDPNLCYNLSSLYEKEGNDDRSDYYLGEAIRLKPEDSEGRMRLAEHLLKRGRFEDAEKHLTELLHRTPDSMNVLLLLSQVAEKRKDSRKQREFYEKILALDPNNQTVMYNLGIMAYEAGDLQGSILYLEKYAKAHPSEREIHSTLFEIYRKQKKDELTLKEAQILTALNPKDPQPYSYIFEYLSARGDYAGIIEVAETALRSIPENLDFRDYLVLALLKTGKEDLALEQMQQILKLTPKDIELMLQIARLQEKKGQTAEAVATYKKILNLAPDNEEAGEAYLRLRMGGLPNAQE